MRCSKFVNAALKQNEETKLFYTNSKKEIVECEFTDHLRKRFVERFKKLTDADLNSEQTNLAIINLFNSSKRIGKSNDEYKKRNKKHGGDSVYFQNVHLVFVVENCQVKTVEIVTERELNKGE